MRGVVFLFVFFLTLLCVKAQDCLWMFEVTEGVNENELAKSWDRKACVGGTLSFRMKDSQGYDVDFPSARNPVLRSNFDLGLAYGEDDTIQVAVEVMCNSYTPLCSNGLVFYVVRSKASSTSSTSSTPQPQDNSTSSSTSSSTPSPTSSSSTSSTNAPADLVCTKPDTMSLEISQSKVIDVLSNVQNCPNPFLSIVEETNTINSANKYFSIDGTSLHFGQKTMTDSEGIFSADIKVTCSNGQNCIVQQSVKVKKTLTPAPVDIPSCGDRYIFPVFIGSSNTLAISLNDADAKLCPLDSSSREFVFTDATSPKYNPDKFSLDSTGTMKYVAPTNPDVDGVDFVINCAPTSAPASLTPLCKASALIPIKPSPTETPVDNPCPGNYEFSYQTGDDDKIISQEYKIFDSLAQNGVNCIDAQATISMTKDAVYGDIDMMDPLTGSFIYKTSLLAPLKDSFTFNYVCGSYSCQASPQLTVLEGVENRVYHLRDNTIICTGTCDSNADQDFDQANNLRSDGRSSDDISFDFTEDGELLIRAYTRIQNLAVRFVTFYPLEMAGALDSPDSVLVGSHMSFEPSCLSEQPKTGNADDIWVWTDKENAKGHLKVDPANYKMGDNYYHTFGGNHRQCDVFRADPCKYAPLMTPTVNDDNNNDYDDQTPAIKWKLYINNCDATWVGHATVESLRALRQPDGSATFKLIGDSQLKGIVYSQSVRPGSLSDPTQNIVTSEKAYELLITIKDSAIIDVEVTETTSDLKVSADIQTATATDKKTGERIYAYSISMYPYTESDGKITNINDRAISEVTLVEYTWKSPSKNDCVSCTGSEFFCKGTGEEFATDCGAKGIVSFEKLDTSIYDFNTAPSSPGGSELFPSTNMAGRSYLNEKISVRVNGENSGSEIDASPVASFVLKIKLNTSEEVLVKVQQTNYISEINTEFTAKICRASAYWPVADSLGNSVPIAPFTSATYPPITTNSDGQNVLLVDNQCPANVGEKTRVTLASMDGSSSGGENLTPLKMCSVEENQAYGVTDWIYISLGSIQQDRKSNIKVGADEVVIYNASSDGMYYTIAELQYLVLSVPAEEAISYLTITDSANNAEESESYINILLDGSHPPDAVEEEEHMWITGNEGSVDDSLTVTYYDWKKYASFLSYRRINFQSGGEDAAVSQPFNFAFIPGALLHSKSDLRVNLGVTAGIKFTTYKISDEEGEDPIKVSERSDRMFDVITVSRATSAALRFDTDAYEPEIVKIYTSGIGKKTASGLLIATFVAIVIVLAASVYIEITYKRLIHNAKYRPKRPDSAVGVRYGRDGKPKSGYGYETASNVSASNVNRDDVSSQAKSYTESRNDGKDITSKFGKIHVEPPRVKDQQSDSEVADHHRNSSSDKLSTKEEKDRVSIDFDEKADL